MSKNQGNSEEQQTVDAVMNADSGNFFDDLEKNVNSVVYDDVQDDSATSEQVTSVESGQNSDASKGVDWDSDDNPYKKRYSDSSREAQKLAQTNKDNEQYGAIINVMKKDPKLIETVQDYLQNGGQPQSVKEQYKLGDDFVFDPDDAFSNPQSQSAQVFDRVVEKIVDRKVQQAENNMSNKIQQTEADRGKRAEARQWMKNNNMTEKEFASMMDKADKHKITYDDINLILNKDRVQQNVANSTKKQMAEQMKNARTVPQTASAVNSAETGEVAVEDQIFNAMKGLDSTDNLFGE
jgi:hypothetical protein